ncbi:MAG: CsbD family protein, partial [Microcystaceae cyanobacterium]
LKGKAQEDIGTVKQNLGKVQGQTEEVDEQIKGRAQQDIGEVKRSSEEAGSDLDNASENVVDAIKHFFGQ